MEKVLKFGVVLILVLSMLIIAAPQAEMFVNPVTTVKIGLYYGSNVLPSANLLNNVGSGYSFGYFDVNRQFQRVGETGVTALTMMKDWNMYLYGGAYYDEEPSGSYSVIGCYHVLLDRVFSTFEEAVAEANTYTLTRAFPAYFSGQYRVCVGSYISYAQADEARSTKNIPGTVFSASNKCITVVETGTTNILFEFDCGEGASLAVMPKAAPEEKAITWFKSIKYYGAFQYTRISGENITVVNVLDIEDYVKGVVPNEMGPSWPLEALKAQAMCARTYVASHINNHKSNGFDLCNTTCCQAYRGTNLANANTDAAVEGTSGLYILYNDQLCETYYFSSDGGATESSQNVWSEAVPYLVGVIDPYECNVNTGRDYWSYTYTNADITWILKAKNYSCSDIVSVTPVYTAMGNIYSLKFTDSNGRNFTFSGSSAGSILYSSTLEKYTYSQRFTIRDSNSTQTPNSIYVNGPQGILGDVTNFYAIGSGGAINKVGATTNITVMTGSGQKTIDISGSGVTLTSGSYTVTGSGWGHNVGMSQYGANAMAKLGFTFDQIIKFYFTGVTIG